MSSKLTREIMRPGPDPVNLNESRKRMLDFIDRHYFKNRHPLDKDTNRVSRDIQDHYGGKIVSAQSGEECLTWIIPKKWTVEEAYIERENGERIADASWHPLYLHAYSSAFSGKMEKEDILQHVSSIPEQPDRLKYNYRRQFNYGEHNGWGFSLPHRVVESLQDETYLVHIDAHFDDGIMEVLDWTFPGESQDTVFFAAHSCHPALVNDGLACIAVFLELFRWLKEKRERRYTYRLFVGPEYFAAAVILAKARDIKDLKAGFFLDMAGNGKKMGFSRSFSNDSYIDHVASNVFNHNFPDHFETPYRGLWANDEMFYDGPGFHIPTLGVGRDRFDEYHTDRDDIALCDFAQLEETLTAFKDIVEILEGDVVPAPKFKGPLYLKRYDLYIDYYKDRDGYKNLQNIQILMNGKNTCMDIAGRLDIDFKFVRKFVDQLYKNDLVEISPANRL